MDTNRSEHLRKMVTGVCLIAAPLVFVVSESIHPDDKTNAADEVAVAAFLEGSIPFTGIAAAIARVLERMPAREVTHFDDLFATDAEARRRTEEQIGELAAV